MLNGTTNKTRSSAAVAVIADRTAYGILANYHQTGFSYKLRSDSTGRVYECTQTQSTQA